MDKCIVDRYATSLMRLHTSSEIIDYYENLLFEAKKLIYEASKHTTSDIFYDKCIDWEESYNDRRKNV